MQTILAATAATVLATPTFTQWAASNGKVRGVELRRALERVLSGGVPTASTTPHCAQPFSPLLAHPSLLLLVPQEYTTREELVLRRAIYAANVAKIEAHNAEAAQGKHTWTMGVNKFADILPAEFSVSCGAHCSRTDRRGARFFFAHAFHFCTNSAP